MHFINISVSSYSSLYSQKGEEDRNLTCFLLCNKQCPLFAIIRIAEKNIKAKVRFTVSEASAISFLRTATLIQTENFVNSLSSKIVRDSEGFSVYLSPRLLGGGTVKSKPNALAPSAIYFTNVKSAPFVTLVDAQYPPKSTRELASLIKKNKATLETLDKQSTEYSRLLRQQNICVEHAFQIIEYAFNKPNELCNFVRELQFLALSLDGNISRMIVEQCLYSIRDSVLINFEVLRLLSFAFREFPEEAIEPQHFIEAIQFIQTKIKEPSQRSDVMHLKLLLVNLGDILDTMIDGNILELDRVTVYDPLFCTLDEIVTDKTRKNIWPFAKYAKEALLHCNTEETTFKSILRRGGHVIKGGIGLASAIANLSYEELREAYTNLRESVMGLSRKNPAYDDLRFMKVMFQLGHYEDLEKLVYSSEYSGDRMVAGNLVFMAKDGCLRHPDVLMCRKFASFLKFIFCDTNIWGNHKSVQNAALAGLADLVDSPSLTGHIQRICSSIPTISLTKNQSRCLENLSSQGVDITKLIPNAQPISREVRRTAFNQVSKDLNIFPIYETLREYREQRLQKLDEELDDYQMVVAKRDPFSAFSREFDLQSDLNHFLNRSVSRVLLITGDSGSGKSTSCKFLERSIWLSREIDGTIPLFVHLSALKDPVYSLMQESLRLLNFTDEQIEAVRKSDWPFVVFADGFDELSNRENLFLRNHLDQWNVKLVITCRTQALTESKANYLGFFKDHNQRVEQASILPFTDAQTQAYIELYRDKFRWNDEEFEIYQRILQTLSEGIHHNPLLLNMLVKVLPRLWSEHRLNKDPLRITPEDARAEYEHMRVGNTEFYRDFLGPGKEPKALGFIDATSMYRELEAYLEEVQPNWNAQEAENYRRILFSIPEDTYRENFFMEVVVERIPQIWRNYLLKASMSFHLTVTELYTKFTEQWFEINEAKLMTQGKIRSRGDIKRDFLDFATRFANEMVCKDIISVNSQEKPWNNFFLGLRGDAIAEQLETVQSGVPIHRQGTSVYTFNHASYRDFFAARSLYLECVDPDFCPLDYLLGKRRISFFDTRLVISPKYHLILRFLAEYVHLDTAFRDALIDKVFSSKDNPETATAASNAITILNVARVSLSRVAYLDQKNFSRINISKANVSHMICDGVDFSGSNLKGVKATGISADGADFSDCQLQDLSMNEQILLPIPLPVSCSSLSSDGKWLAVTGPNTSGFIDVFDREKREHLGTLQGHDDQITCLSFSPDGSRLVSGSLDRTVRVWRREDLTVEHIFDSHKEPIGSILFLPESNQLVSIDIGSRVNKGGRIGISITNNQGYIWNLENGTRDLHFQTTFDYKNPRLFYVKDNRTLYVSPLNGSTVYRYPLDLSNDTTSTISGIVGNIIATRGQWILAAENSKHAIRLYTAEQDSIVCELLSQEAVSSLEVSSDGKIALVGYRSGNISLWNLSKKVKVQDFRGHRCAVDHVSFSEDGNKVFSVSNGDRTVRQWVIEKTDSLPYLEQGEWAPPNTLDQTLLRGVFYINDEDNSICGDTRYVDREYYLPDGSTISRSQWNYFNQFLKRHSIITSDESSSDTVVPAQISLSGEYAVHQQMISDEAYLIPLLDLNTGREYQFIFNEYETLIELCFTADSRYIVSLAKNTRGGDIDPEADYIPHLTEGGAFRIWSIEEKKELQKTFEADISFTCMRTLMRSNGIVAGSTTGDLYMWQLGSDPLYFHPGPEEYIQCLDVSQMDTLVVTGSKSGVIGVWDILSKKHIQSLHPDDESIVQIAVSPDQSKIVTATEKGDISLIDFETGKEISRLDGHYIPNSRVVFTPCGRFIVIFAPKESRVWMLNPSTQDLILIYRSTFPSLSVKDAIVNLKSLEERTQTLLMQHGAQKQT